MKVFAAVGGAARGLKACYHGGKTKIGLRSRCNQDRGHAGRRTFGRADRRSKGGDVMQIRTSMAVAAALAGVAGLAIGVARAGGDKILFPENHAKGVMYKT